MLFVVGQTAPHLIARHKRLQGFAFVDFRVLERLVVNARDLVLLANTLTEASNWLDHTAEPDRGRVFVTFQALIRTRTERYVDSRTASLRPEFLRLGLADTALLVLASQGVVILSTDSELSIAAQKAGYGAVNFNHEPHRLGP